MGSHTPSIDSLCALHRAHLLAVPFENLDIGWGRTIVLDDDALYRKIVERCRGGFCYELNGLFARLLRALGFDVTMLSARVADRNDVLGPDFDHMVLLVSIDETRWLVDLAPRSRPRALSTFSLVYVEILETEHLVDRTVSHSLVSHLFPIGFKMYGFDLHPVGHWCFQIDNEDADDPAILPHPVRKDVRGHRLTRRIHELPGHRSHSEFHPFTRDSRIC